MELEKQLCDALAKQDPGLRFTHDVLQRLSRARANRKIGRRVVVGTIFCVAAAACMLAWQVMKQQSHQVPAVPTMAADAPPIAPSTPVQSSQEKGLGKAESPSPDSVPLTAWSFTVALLPPRYEKEEPAHKAAVAALHAALQEKLPAVPNLRLVEPGTAADFRLTVTGIETDTLLSRGSYKTSIGPEGTRETKRVAPAVEWFSFKLNADITAQGKNGRGYTISQSGYLPGQCQVKVAVEPAGVVCPEPDAVADQLVEMLRKEVFPLDPSIPRALRARLQDRGVTDTERFNALGGLNELIDSGRSDGWTPADLRDAMEINMPDVQMNGMSVRSRILAMLRDIHDPAFIAPLLELLGRDTDRQVRMEAAANLGQNFIGDPAVRNALEATARSDSQQLVRHVALRSLTGEGEWREFVAATLKDKTLSAAERVEPLLYSEQALSRVAAKSANPIPDDMFVPAAVELFPALAADEGQTFSALLLLNRLSDSVHPAVKGLMMRLVREGDESHSDRAAQYLLYRYPDARDVRQLLEAAGARNARIRDLLEAQGPAR